MHNVLNITKVSLLPSLKGFDTLVGAAHAFNLAPVFIPIVDLIIRPHICPDSVWCRPLQREWLAPGGLVTTPVNLYSAGYRDICAIGLDRPESLHSLCNSNTLCHHCQAFFSHFRKFVPG